MCACMLLVWFRCVSWWQQQDWKSVGSNASEWAVLFCQKTLDWDGSSEYVIQSNALGGKGPLQPDGSKVLDGEIQHFDFE